MDRLRSFWKNLPSYIVGITKLGGAYLAVLVALSIAVTAIFWLMLVYYSGFNLTTALPLAGAAFGSVGLLFMTPMGSSLVETIVEAVLRWRRSTATEPSTLYGDARHANIRRDGEKLRYLLYEKGIFFGCMTTWADSYRGTPTVTPLHYGGPAHVMTIAPSRSGKGTCAIIPNLLTLENSVLVIDPKGENAAVTAAQRSTFGPVHLLNPFNEHGLGSSRFNPLAHLSIESPHLVADVAGLAEALIISDGKEAHWSESARTLVRLILLHLIAEKGGGATLIDMRRLLTQDAKNFGVMIFEMMNSPHGFISQPAAQFESETKEIQSIISTARTQTAFLDDPSIVHVLLGSDFTMLDLKTRPTSVYIILPSRYLVAYSRFFRLLVVAALDSLQSRAGGIRTTFILDEFAALGRLSAIETAFGQAAGFNVQLWPILQDLNQLKELYNNRWESFIANSGVVQWFRPNDSFTAEYLSKRLGNKTVVTHSTSDSSSSASTQDSVINTSGNKVTNTSGSSSTYGETGVPFMTPVELMGMHEMSCIVTLTGLRYPILSTWLPHRIYEGYLNKGVPKLGKDQAGKAMSVVMDFYKRFHGKYNVNPFHT